MSTDMDTAGTTDRRKRRRTVVVLKFGLAGAALLGIGLAATSAAWSNDAWFTANAKAAGTTDLQGANVTGGVVGTFYAADSSTAADIVQIPSAAFNNLQPNVTRTATIALKNVGTADLNIASAATWSGSFGATNTCSLADITVTKVTAPSALASGAEDDTVTVTVTPPDTWPTSCQDKTDTLLVSFTGTPTP